jgi:hypothetical protein
MIDRRPSRLLLVLGHTQCGAVKAAQARARSWPGSCAREN